MTTPPNFGRRGPGQPPLPDRYSPEAVVARRRLRSNLVIIGCAGALGLGVGAAAEYRAQHCRPQIPNDPNSIPDSCRHSYSSAGHGYYGSYGEYSGVGSSTSRASFGGFGASGTGHGSGT